MRPFRSRPVAHALLRAAPRLIAVLGFLVSSSTFAYQSGPLRESVVALQRGDFPTAERILRAEIAAHPTNAPALSTLAVALDNQKKFAEAAPFHQRAIAAAPRIADVRNNYGNHLAATGDLPAAEAQYRKAIALDPANVNANLQLARLALDRPGAPQALDYLDHVPASQLDALAAGDPRFGFAAAIAYANAGQFARAETLFTQVLTKTPADFNVLFNLGVVAASAGHTERARDILEAALRQQPQNVEVLLRLASIEQSMQQPDAALRHLAPAARLAPARAEIQRMIAVAATSLGALDDAIAAWDRYRKLAPSDDLALRERAFAAVELGRIEEGAAALESYLARHPNDAIAHYQLGVARGDTSHLTRALELKPDFTAARSARGYLFYQRANFEAALADLEPAAAERPGDPVILDRLGQAYLALDRPADGVRILRRAAELAPTDSKTQFHLGRALAEAGDAAGSKLAMGRFRELGPASKAGVPAGLVDYLSLTPGEQRADYRARVEKALREHPGDPAAKLDWFKLAVEDGNLPEAAVAGAVAALTQALPTRADLYWHTVSLLLRAGRLTGALALPVKDGDTEAQLMQAVVSELAGRAEAASLLDDLQARRPEWFAVWVARAFVLAAHHRAPEAAKAMATARSLGARTSDTGAGLSALLQQKPPRDW